jgi:hypothetical protein
MMRCREVLAATPAPLSASKLTYSKEQLTDLRPHAVPVQVPEAVARKSGSGSANLSYLPSSNAGSSTSTATAAGRRPFANASGPSAPRSNSSGGQRTSSHGGAPSSQSSVGMQVQAGRMMMGQNGPGGGGGGGGGPGNRGQMGRRGPDPRGGRDGYGGGQGGNMGPPMGSGAVAPLKRTANRWMRGLPTLNDDQERARLLAVRTSKSILNKLTYEFFPQLKDALLAVPIPDAQTLDSVVGVVFNKALDEPKFAPLYAKMCKEIHLQMPSFAVKVEPEDEEDADEDGEPRAPSAAAPQQPVISFRRQLLLMCQRWFENIENIAELREVYTHRIGCTCAQ